MISEQNRRIEQLAAGYFALAAQHRQIAAMLGQRSSRAEAHKRQASALDELGIGWLRGITRLASVVSGEGA